MPRPAGWAVLAIKALELSSLALISRLLNGRTIPQHVEPPSAVKPVEPQPDPAPADIPATVLKSEDEPARYYRAADEAGEVVVAFFDDGRIRLTGAEHSFAGILQDGQADLLDLDDNTWSEVFVRSTPQGQLQLEVRGGAFHGRILTCEPIARPHAVIDAV